MSRDERERLRDIVEALETIRDHVGGSLEEPSIDDPVVLDAVLFRLMVIGEAAKNVGAEALEGATPRAASGGARSAGLNVTARGVSAAGPSRR